MRGGASLRWLALSMLFAAVQAQSVWNATASMTTECEGNNRELDSDAPWPCDFVPGQMVGPALTGGGACIIVMLMMMFRVHARAAALPESPELLRKYASASILRAVTDIGHPMHDTMMRKQRVADGIVYEFLEYNKDKELTDLAEDIMKEAILKEKEKYKFGGDIYKIGDDIQSASRVCLNALNTHLNWVMFVTTTAIVVAFTVSTRAHADNTDGWRIGGCFVSGAILTFLPAHISVSTATHANIKICQKSYSTRATGEGAHRLNKAFRMAYQGAAVISLGTFSFGLITISGFLLFMTLGRPFDNSNMKLAARSLIGCALGSSCTAVFVRISGGIYSKAADIGQSVLGKLEEDIPTPDKDNPASIAKNAGAVIGNIVGSSVDMAETLLCAIAACVLLAFKDESGLGKSALISLPFWIAASSCISGCAGFYYTVQRRNHHKHAGDIRRLINQALLLVVLGQIAMNAGVVALLLQADRPLSKGGVDDWTRSNKYFQCLNIGLLCGVLIGVHTHWFTDPNHHPTQTVVASGITGTSTVVIQGLGIGMLSCCLPTIALIAAIGGCNQLLGDYGVALGALGMVSTMPFNLSLVVFGGITSTTGGLADLSYLPESVQQVTNELRMVGHSMNSIGKTFSTANAAFTSIAVIGAYRYEIGLSHATFDIVSMCGTLFGAAVPFFICCSTMLSARKAASLVVTETRSQYLCPASAQYLKNEGLTFHPAILVKDDRNKASPPGDTPVAGDRAGRSYEEKYKRLPDHSYLVKETIRTSAFQTILPMTYAVLIPLGLALLIGPRCLLGVLTGTVGSGFMLSCMIGTAGHCWENALEFIERACGPPQAFNPRGIMKKIKDYETGKETQCMDEFVLEGSFAPSDEYPRGGRVVPIIKASSAQRHAVASGDTLGDPLKDSSVPAINTVMKVMTITSLAVAPLLQPYDAAAKDWVDYEYGLAPLGIGLVVTVLFYWSDGWPYDNSLPLSNPPSLVEGDLSGDSKSTRTLLSDGPSTMTKSGLFTGRQLVTAHSAKP